MKARAPHPPGDSSLDTTALVLRPDVLRATLVAEVDSGSLEQCISALEGAAVALRRAVEAVHPEGKVLLRGFDLVREVKLKSRSGGEELRPRLTGALELPLAPQLDYWARVRLLATLWAVTDNAVAQGLRSKPKIRAAFGPPLALLRSPEDHRRALMQRWFDRVGELSELAGASGTCAGLRLRSCALPGPVAQRTRSLEEVELVLDMVAEGPLEAIDVPVAAGPAAVDNAPA